MEEYEYQNGPEVTDPYRPPVGATPSDDIELIIKRRYKLPAVNRGVCLCQVEVNAANRTHRKIQLIVRDMFLRPTIEIRADQALNVRARQT